MNPMLFAHLGGYINLGNVTKINLHVTDHEVEFFFADGQSEVIQPGDSKGFEMIVKTLNKLSVDSK